MGIDCTLRLDAAPAAPASIVHHVGVARGLNRKLAVIRNQVTSHLTGLAVEKLPCPGLSVREREHRNPVRVPNVIRRTKGVIVPLAGGIVPVAANPGSTFWRAPIADMATARERRPIWLSPGGQLQSSRARI